MSVNFLIGEVILYAGPTNLEDFAPCNGSLLSAANYPDLWNQIGYSYGGSNDSFALPNLTSPLAGATYLIRVDNGSTGDNASFAYNGGMLADIRYLAGPPRSMPGCPPADGRLLPISGNQAAFALLGNRFGGSGNDFAIPTIANLGDGVGVPAYFLSSGAFPSQESTYAETMIAQIQLAAPNFVEASFLACDGSTLNLTNANAILFSLLGTKFGGSDRTFALPALAPTGGVSYRICHQGIYPRRDFD